MKKIIIFLSLVLSLLLVGCSTGERDLNITSDNKAEEYGKFRYEKYFEKLSNIREDTIDNHDLWMEKTEEYKDVEEFNGTDKVEKEMEKDFIEQLSAIKTDNAEINSIQNEIIEISINIYNSYSQKIKIYQEGRKMGEIGEEKLSDKEKEKFNKMEEEYEGILDYIDRQKEKRDEKIEELGKALEYFFEN